ncbi:MAG: Xaa-Pro aminopeptidase, partial [Bacteroidota bacterium]|nr:Xaa-Pro aminopeptidase [Bacteroidota bacterium]
TDRRHEVMNLMKKGSIAVFYSNDEMPRTADQIFPFRQESALFAISGIDQPGTIIVLFPEAKKKSEREIAFILPADPQHTIWNGERLTPKEAQKISGITNIRTVTDLDRIMTPLFHTVQSIYLNIADLSVPAQIINQNERMALKLKSIFPFHVFHSVQPILRKLLMRKHKAEIDLMKKAIDVTAQGFNHVLREIKPGMKEYEVEAMLSYTFVRNACGHAFQPIIASGASACILHYVQNDRRIGKEDLVLLDFGAEYANMASDMSRTIPASGRFTKEQKKFYNSVLKVLREATSFMTPGNTLTEIQKESGNLIEHELISLGLCSRREVKRQDPKSPLWKKYFMHGISHHLGYDVHDHADRNATLKSGMVLTCEPGLYIPEMKLGIRLENDILVTRSAPKDLMAHVPIEIEEIESIMQS